MAWYRLVDSTTWRNFGYLMAWFPLSIVEFAIGIAAIVLLPIAIWVAPWIGWIHGTLALSLLGPNRAERLAVQARHL